MQSAEGGCLCSAIRYRVTGVPQSSSICHCNTCRKASAAPSVAWVKFELGDFELLTGQPQYFRSSPDVVRSFCNACGTPLTYQSDDSPNTIDLTTVSLDDPNRFPPTREIWLEHRLPWEANNEAIAQYQGDSREGP
jgi:hypothetical protein